MSTTVLQKEAMSKGRMQIQQRLPLVEEILAPWRAQIGADFDGYHNHVYRMIHFCFALRLCSEVDQHKIIIAACFHDIGIWSKGSLDYLPPSVDEARRYLQLHQLDEWIAEVELMIDMHHKFRPYRDDRYPLVELFRQGDWVDFSLGLVKFGLSRDCIREVKAPFPNAGFHKRLTQLTVQWFLKHPLTLPPILKW